jgi:dimethylhistidine N-methyltransferase
MTTGKTFSVETTEKRLQIEYLLTPSELSTASTDGSDVVEGLTQTVKSLPPRYFYDDRGSQLFEKICDLPEYYLTRTETVILRKYANEIAQLTGACEIVELGSGSSTKTRLLLDAYEELGFPLHYSPIDVSAGILESSARELLADYSSLVVHGLVSTYEQALANLKPSPLPQRMICFIGSTLGNLNQRECDRFFAQITEALQIGEYFLLGIDLQKPTEILEAAYNDSQGVTAAFNLNMLAHLNRRFQGNFDLNQFQHWSFFNSEKSQIEMHLRSLTDQIVQLRTLDLTIKLAAGETIFTEISRKFNLPQMRKYLTTKGLAPVQIWTDPKQWFSLLLCQRQNTK